QTPGCFEAFRPDQRAIIASVRPGLSGAASVIFRNEEALFIGRPDPIAFDRSVIIPYKGEIECWLVENRSLALYLQLLALTLLAVALPRSRAHASLLKAVPSPPAELACLI